MYKLLSEGPLKYNISGGDQTVIEHSHEVCACGCDVPFTIYYILDSGVKKAMSYLEDKFSPDCTDWQGE
jgi:hypothetical protein